MRYIKNNYKYVLKMDEVIDNAYNILTNERFENEKWKTYLNDIQDENLIQHIRGYIQECCDIVWIMLLQDPVLELMPKEWYKDDSNLRQMDQFDDKRHTRALGSDGKSKQILYYIWRLLLKMIQFWMIKKWMLY